MPISSPLYLLVSSLRQNLNIGFTVNYLKVEGLGVQLIFNKNIIKLGDNKEYIKEAADTIVILYARQRYNCKANVPIYLKISLN